MNPDAYFEQAEQNINLLISKGKFAEANKKCKDLISKYPHEGRFKKLKTKIEDEAKESNRNIVDEKIDEMKTLWEKESYAEILEKISDLQKVVPENTKLKKLQEKAQKLYKEKLAEQTEKYVETQTLKLEKMLENDTGSLLDEIIHLERNNPNNPNTLKVTTKFREKLIEKKINDNQETLKSSQIEKATKLLEELKAIDPKNKKVMEIEKSMNKKISKDNYKKAKIFMAQSIKQIQELINTENYDKAIKEAEGILKIDPENRSMRKLLKKAQDQSFKQNKELSINEIEKNTQKLEEDYKKDKDKFIKL